MLDLPLSAVPLVFLDLETTGLYPHQGDRVCEVALQRVTGGVVEVSLERLIDPQRPLSAKAFGVNGISATDLADAPVFAEIIDTLQATLEGATLVAHNAPFDLEFLRVELALAGRPPLLIRAIDTLAIARRLLPERRSHSLAALAAALGGAAPAHRALADVLALRMVFDDLAKRMAAIGISTLGDVVRYSRGFIPGDPEPIWPATIAEALHAGQLLRITYASRTSIQPIERTIRPIDITRERGDLYLQAYCYLRQDLRAFAIEKILAIEIEN
jgi:DNA polymerase-3 subunit epsilon